MSSIHVAESLIDVADASNRDNLRRSSSEVQTKGAEGEVFGWLRALLPLEAVLRLRMEVDPREGVPEHAQTHPQPFEQNKQLLTYARTRRFPT